MNLPNPSNIIVRAPNWIGDAVMGTPIFTDLKAHFPNAALTVMCKPSIGTLLQNNPYIDELFIFKRQSGWISHVHQPDIIEPLQFGKYDLGILLTNSFSSAWWFWRGNVQNRIGYKGNLRNFLLNIALPFPENLENQHQVLTYKMLLQPLNIPISNTLPEVFVSEDELINAKLLLSEFNVTTEHILIGINPGAAYGSAKCWPPNRFKALAKKLVENSNIRVIFFSDQAGAALVNDICSEMPESVINLAAKTSLRELMALIKTCNVFITNDSGPMHIASALGIPLIALFGSTSEIKTGPYNGGKVIHKHVECSPCYKRSCPIDFRCMNQIEVNEVYNETLKLI